MSWGDRVGDDTYWRNDTDNPALRRGLEEREPEERARWETHFVGVGARTQGNVMERELVEMGTATLECRANASQDPCGEGYEKHAPSRK